MSEGGFSSEYFLKYNMTRSNISCVASCWGHMVIKLISVTYLYSVSVCTLPGKGQYAAVEFVAIDGGTSEPQTGELCDATSQKLIRFEDLNPFTYTQKTMILSNTT